MPVDLSSTSGRKPTRETWESASAGLVRRYQRAFAKAADMLPVKRIGGVDSQRDRFLTELGARADEVHDQLLRAMRDRATTGDSRELARLCEVVIELQDIRTSHRQAVNEERLHMLTSGQEVSARLSPSAGVKVLLERAATAMCDLPGLERFMVFQREGGVLLAAATVFADHDEWAQDCQTFSASTRYDLAPKRPEALIIRRRSPAIITDALHDPDAFQPIVQKMQAANYVGAPVIAYGDVVATIHGDAYFAGRPVDEVDRDVIASFAASLGPIVERAILIEQLQTLARTYGFITAPLINRTPGMHKAWVYQRRFGTLIDAYHEAGLTPIRNFDFINDHRNHARLRDEFVASVTQLYRKRPVMVRPFDRSNHLCINEKWILMVRIARMHHVPGPRWVIQAVNPRQADLCLIGRLGDDGETLMDYLLVPTLCLPRKKFHVSKNNDLATDLYRFTNLNELGWRADKMLQHDACDMTPTIGRHETRRPRCAVPME